MSQKWHVGLALAAVYIIWGSTYLGIRYALESFPPFLMTSGRFLLVGSMMFGWAMLRGAGWPRRIHWRSAFIVGGLMLFGGTGGVTWAEQTVPSGFAALMIAAVPIWATVLDWLLFEGPRPNRLLLVGLAAGLFGVGLLIGPDEIIGGDHSFDPLGVLALLLAALSWATGSLYSRRAPLPDRQMQATGIEMLAGGVILLAVATLSGEWGELDLAAVSRDSLIAYSYLLTAGGVVVFTAYFWLLRNTTPVRATSYAYVNPVIAVLLGWAVADETLTPRMIVAAVIIIGSVAVITAARAQQGTSQTAPAEPREDTLLPADSCASSAASK